jgi:hypothetical protein
MPYLYASVVLELELRLLLVEPELAGIGWWLA